MSKREIKRKLIKEALESLRENNIDHYTNSDGVHIIIKTNSGTRIDYWPSTQKYSDGKSVKICSIYDIIRISSDIINESEDIMQKDIEKMNISELKKTVYFLCEELNRLNEIISRSGKPV